MGLSYIYKKFSAQDFAIVPFNAHKQYSFTSASAASNSINHYNTSYTSESISLYSSASSIYGGDSKNVIKYNQLDHLFYRDYIQKTGTKKDLISFLGNQRNLYEKANILSIPSGLYGFEIKKSSFYLSSSQYEIIDDSKGNLIISGTTINNYPNNIQENVFRLDPINGHKKYDLNVYDGYAEVFGGDYIDNHPIVYKNYYRKGLINPSAPLTYTTITKFPREYYPQDIDNSYFLNEIYYNNVTFKKSELGSTEHKFSTIAFNSTTSSFIKAPHQEKFNFNTKQDFAISFYIKPSPPNASSTEKRYIIAKSGTETIVSSGSVFADIETPSPQFPYEIYMISQSLYFSRSDGDKTDTINGIITSSGNHMRTSHILCQLSSSVMELWFDGTKIASGTSNLLKSTRNNANLYIGSKGISTTANDSSNIVKYYNGDINNINIWTRPWSSAQIANISESVNASPYIGNIFYNSGLSAITHPKYYSIISGSTGNGIINTLQFQGSHLIYEHEYQCTVQEHEFNTSTNTSALDQTDSNPYKISGFTTSSHFQPYVTTVGLYNQANELLVVGKLGQPIRKSDKTDMTFIVRWDT